MTELTVGEALVGLLEAYGVDTIFGIPGVHNVEMYRALPRSNIRHILPRHEQGAGYMADGYARATGKPGVCFSITGPGLTNLMTPLGQAWSDSSNILVISSALDVTDSAQGRGRLHEMIDQHGAAKSVTSLALRAYTPLDVQDAVARAFSHFASARPRPVYIEVPLDVFAQPAGPGWTAKSTGRKPAAFENDITKATGLLSKAKNPMIILGGGALNAGEAAVSIAEKLGAPILTTTAGKGAVPADHPACWGYCLASPTIQNQLAAADCVLAAGTELSETDVWTTAFRLDGNLIRIDIDPASLARPHTAALAILADAADTLTRINQQLKPDQKPLPVKPEAPEAGNLESMLAKVLSTIRQILPPDTVIASDMTQIAYAANVIFPVQRPRTWLHPVGFGTLGFALPAAIGAKFATGDKPVVALAGDYGLQYSLNELGTAVEHELSLPILLWNNNALGQIRDNMVERGIQPNAVTLRNPDFMALAKAYGAAAERPATLKALAAAIATALKAKGPTLIEMTPAMVHG